MRGLALVIVALALSACGQSSQAPETSSAPVEVAPAAAQTGLPEVEADLLAAPNTAFVAIEPTEIGIIGAPDVREALAPLISVEALPEGETVELTVREQGETATADVVRKGMADDAVGAGHVRVEFHREPEGWFPVNAYRRHQCRRGDGAWTTEPCP